jgi:hypothetical protein
VIDEFPTIPFDRTRSIRFHPQLKTYDFEICLDLQLSATLRPDGHVASLRVIGLRLELYSLQIDKHSKQIQRLFPWLIQTFHSKLPEFPHLRVAEIRSSLGILHLATKAAPEIKQLPTLGGELIYRWGCPRRNFKTVDTEEGCYTVGVDPARLKPSGMCVVHFTCCAAADNLAFRTLLESQALRRGAVR